MSKYSSFFLLSSAEYKKLTDKLRVRKYGSWLAEEAWMKEDQAQKRALFTLKAIDLARKIAAEKGITDEQAFELLQSAEISEDNIMSGFSAEAASLMESMPSSQEQQEALITVFMKNRGEVLNGKKWEPTDDWDSKDTRQLPKPLIDQIQKFMEAEAGDTAGAEEEEDAEKN